MISEKFIQLPDGTIVRRREVQTELAELVPASAGGWRRSLRTWEVK